MKRSCLWFWCSLAGVFPVSAQVTVEVTQDQDQFLPGEAIITAARVTNRSGQTLRLGTEDNWLTFSVESGDRGIVPRSGEAPVTGEFLLESSKVATKRVNLAPYFSASVPGRYSVTATVRIKEWDREFTSQPKKFNVIEGAKLWEQEIGVPKSPGAPGATPEVRKYTLQQAHYLRTELRLYLRLTDATGTKVFRVQAIGPTVSFGQPEPQVDKFSNLHLMYQDRPHAFNYVVFNPDGDVVVRQTYDYVDTRPRLKPDGEGKISVVGGIRRVTSSDWPPPPPEDLPGVAPQPPVPTPEVKPIKPSKH
jgi:hypothetical protein